MAYEEGYRNLFQLPELLCLSSLLYFENELQILEDKSPGNTYRKVWVNESVCGGKKGLGYLCFNYTGMTGMTV